MFAGNVARDHLGVHAVGFTAPTDALSVAAQITRIDHKHFQPRLMRELGEQLVVATGRIKAILFG